MLTLIKAFKKDSFGLCYWFSTVYPSSPLWWNLNLLNIVDLLYELHWALDYPNMEIHLITEGRHHWNALPFMVLVHFFKLTSTNKYTKFTHGVFLFFLWVSEWVSEWGYSTVDRYNFDCNKKHHEHHHSEPAVMDPNYFTLCTVPCVKWKHSPTFLEEGGGRYRQKKEQQIKRGRDTEDGGRKPMWRHTGGMEKESLIPGKASTLSYPLFPLHTTWLCFLDFSL